MTGSFGVPGAPTDLGNCGETGTESARSRSVARSSGSGTPTIEALLAEAKRLTREWQRAYEQVQAAQRRYGRARTGHNMAAWDEALDVLDDLAALKRANSRALLEAVESRAQVGEVGRR